MPQLWGWGPTLLWFEPIDPGEACKYNQVSGACATVPYRTSSEQDPYGVSKISRVLHSSFRLRSRIGVEKQFPKEAGPPNTSAYVWYLPGPNCDWSFRQGRCLSYAFLRISSTIYIPPRPKLTTELHRSVFPTYVYIKKPGHLTLYSQ